VRRHLIVLTVVAVLVAVNWGIYQRERLISEGRIVLLELAPVDPRSLMQGDYMALRFRVANDAMAAQHERASNDGYLIVAVDDEGVGSFRRLDNSTPLAGDEVKLRYRMRAGQMKFGTNAFFFQEGQADRYARARFGEFRVGVDGEMILTGMRGAELQPLNPSG
jgi:uncharacterized membrane-anchored protein